MGLLPENRESDKQTMSLFLSLYLIILVFLIALLANSSFEGLRLKTATASVRESFKSNIKFFNNNKKIRFLSGNNDGFLLNSDDTVVENEGNVFLPELPLEEIKESESGNIMYTVLKKSDIFEPDMVSIRNDKLTFLKNIVERMASAKDGYKYEIEIMLGYFINHGEDDGKNFKALKNIMETMLNYGINPYNISVGMSDVGSDNLRITFSLKELEG